MPEMLMPNAPPEMSSEEKMALYKERSKICAFDGRPSFVDGCTINIVAITETGNVVAPFETKSGSGTSAIVPTCAYHMVLAQEGLIAITTQNQFIQSKLLTQLEPGTDEELKRLILQLGRGLKTDLTKAQIRVAKIIIKARKFDAEMEKGLKEAREKKDEMS
jgi:hypothetical protein